MKLFAFLALLISSIGSTIAQEPPQAPMADWKILSPAPGAVMTGPIPWVDVYVRVPMQSSIRIELQRLNGDGSGEVLWTETTGGSIISKRFQKNGDMMPPGEYTANLFDMSDVKQIADSVQFTIVSQEGPRSFPSITNPVPGTVYIVDDRGLAPVSIGGVAGSDVWLVLYKDGEFGNTTRVPCNGAPNFYYHTTFDLPAGTYLVQAYSINPSDLRVLPSDSTTFVVIEVPVIAPPSPEPAPDTGGTNVDGQVNR